MKLFSGYWVLFPLASIQLSRQRVQILSELVLKYGGQSWVFASQHNQHWVAQFRAAVQDRLGFVAVGTDAKIQDVENRLFQLGLSADETQQAIISADWVSQSITKQSIVNVHEYARFVKQPELDKKDPVLDYLTRRTAEPEPEFDMSDDDLRIYKDHDKKNQAARHLMSNYREMLDYNYDPLLDNYHNDYDDDDDDLDLRFLKKEEFHEEVDFKPQPVPDQDCQITQVKLPNHALSLFDGIDLPRHIDLTDTVQTSVLRNFQTYNPGLRRKAKFWEPKKGHFVCESGSSNKNLNQQIIDQLDKLLKCYTNDRDKGRMYPSPYSFTSIAYKKAIAFIKSLSFQIKSVDDVNDMPTIGHKIKNKIKEIIQTGKLQKAEFLCSNSKNQAIELFSKIWGIGAQTAAMLYFKGMKTYEDLHNNLHLLTRNQQIGLKYVDDFQQRIPREEATKIYEIVRDTVNSMSEIENIYECIPCGSYRRGKETCGDMDILITRKDGKQERGLLEKIIQKLEGTLLTDHLVHPRMTPHESETYMGVGRIGEGPRRRVDIKIYPREQFGYAVLYFTGSDHFNRSMRLYAQKKGYSLSDHGLYPTLRSVRNKKVWQGEVIPCYCEEDVFKILGLTYKKPENRSV